jgi:hypothetical protein
MNQTKADSILILDDDDLFTEDFNPDTQVDQLFNSISLLDTEISRKNTKSIDDSIDNQKRLEKDPFYWTLRDLDPEAAEAAIKGCKALSEINWSAVNYRAKIKRKLFSVYK